VSRQDITREEVGQGTEGVHCHQDGPHAGIDVLAGITDIQVMQDSRLMQVLKVDHILQGNAAGEVSKIELGLKREGQRFACIVEAEPFL
jgi:hypothetical protein